MLVVAVGLHIDGAGRILVQERLPGDKRGGLWEFPGGKVEPGETMRAALAREWKEELGLEIAAGALVTEIVLSFPEVSNVLLPLFEVILDSNDVPQPMMGQRIRHVTYEQLLELPGVPSMPLYAPYVQRLVRRNTK